MRVYRETLLIQIDKAIDEFYSKYGKRPTHLELTKEESKQFMEEVMDKHILLCSMEAHDHWLTDTDPQSIQYKGLQVVVKG